MQTLDPRFRVEKENVSAKTLLWSQSGPFLLLGAFIPLISKSAPSFLPLLLVAFTGYVVNLIWKKKGFYFSLMMLAIVSIYTIQSGIDIFWSSLLSTSVAFSLLLVFLGRQESEAVTLDREEKIKILEKNQSILEKQICEAKASLSEENKENIFERERLNHLYAQTSLDLNQAKQSLQVSEKERERLNERCETISQDIFSYQRKEIAFQHALDDAQAQLLKLKNQQLMISTNRILQEDSNPQEKIDLGQVQCQYALMREQFNEKSEALDKARQELFYMENEFLTLQKAQAETALEASEDLHLLKELKKLEEEYSDLEAQVCGLQEFISVLLSPKKRTTRSHESIESEEHLPLLIQGKIDQTTGVWTDFAPETGAKSV